VRPWLFIGLVLPVRCFLFSLVHCELSGSGLLMLPNGKAFTDDERKAIVKYLKTL
jgi:hypothetical protein